MSKNQHLTYKIIWGINLQWFVVFFTSMLLGSQLMFAQDADIPKPMSPARLVNDFAQMLTSGENTQLEHKLDSFSKATSTQIAVVTVNSLNGRDVAEYNTELGHEWGVGEKSKGNGVVLLISKNDRKLNIAVGHGLEGALTDITSGQIIRNEITPFFKAGNYYEGIDNGTNAIMQAVKGEYHADETNDQNDDGLGFLPIVFLIIIVLIIIWIIRKGGGNNGGRGGNYYSRGGNDFLTGMILGNLLNGGGRGSSGGGFGGFGGGSDSGGFGGFGGGDFGGGGASGSW